MILFGMKKGNALSLSNVDSPLYFEFICIVFARHGCNINSTCIYLATQYILLCLVQFKPLLLVLRLPLRCNLNEDIQGRQKRDETRRL